MSAQDSFFSKDRVRAAVRTNWMQGLLFILIVVILISALYVPAWLKLSQHERQLQVSSPKNSTTSAVTAASHAPTNPPSSDNGDSAGSKLPAPEPQAEATEPPTASQSQATAPSYAIPAKLTLPQINLSIPGPNAGASNPVTRTLSPVENSLNQILPVGLNLNTGGLSL